jgi:NAD(P)-dependent dehydrogenase (short-subunit alcohol dehydrogenase family)
MGKLEGKVALVTGGNSGIGLASAKQFVNEGAYVFITGRRDRELAAAVKEIGRNVIGVQGDAANFGDLDRLFAQIKREKGRLDIVFANAGASSAARRCPTPCRSAGSARPTRSPRRWSFSLRTTAAMSREQNCSWMAGSPKYRPAFGT